jgi:hypothetical protein
MESDDRDRRGKDREIADTVRRNSTSGLQQASPELLRKPAHTASGTIPISIRALFYEMLEARGIGAREPNSDLRRP